MRKLKLFTLALAAMFAGSAMAADYVLDGSTSYAIPYTFEGSSVTIKPDARWKVEQKQMWNNSSEKAYGVKIGNSANSNIDTAFIEISCANEMISGLELSASTNSSGAGKRYSVLYCSEAPFNKDKIIRVEEQLSISKDSADAARVFTVPANTQSVRIYRLVKYNDVEYGEGSSVYIYRYKITTTPFATNIATLSGITVDGEAIADFAAETLTYNVELPYGTTDVPTVVATTTSPKAKVSVTPASALPGSTSIVVTAEDNTTTKTYTVNFSIASAASSDATLKSLMIDTKAIPGFKADSLEYAYQLDYAKTPTMPKVTAELNDETASIVITDITALPGTATVVVTAQDRVTTKTYKVAFTMAEAPKILSEVVFSNGAKGAAVASTGTLMFPYIAGTAVPTISSIKVNDGASYVQGENKITVTGEDGSSLDYTITAVELPVAVLEDNIEDTFDGTENYIFSPYGWDSSKGWKFSKNVEDDGNRRVSEGRSRIYMALPAADSVALISGSVENRDVKIYVNNVENTSVKKTAKSGESIKIALNNTSVNLLAIESNQTSGDGGFTKIKLVPKTSPTGVDAASVEVKVVKRIVNGQLVIEKDGVLYNALGNVVK